MLQAIHTLERCSLILLFFTVVSSFSYTEEGQIGTEIHITLYNIRAGLNNIRFVRGFNSWEERELAFVCY